MGGLCKERGKFANFSHPSNNCKKSQDFLQLSRHIAYLNESSFRVSNIFFRVLSNYVTNLKENIWSKSMTQY